MSKSKLQNKDFYNSGLISLRSDQGSMERSKKIISAMQQNGFTTEDNATTFFHYKDEDRGIKKN